MVARAVAEQQFRQARVAEAALQRGQLLRRGGAGEGKQRLVAVAEETVVQRGVNVGHGGGAGLVVDLAGLLGQLRRKRAQPFHLGLDRGHVQAEARVVIGAQVVPGDQRRHLVQMHLLQRHPCDALGQLAGAQVQALRDHLGRQCQQIVDVTVQVEHDHPVVDGRVHGQRQHRRRAQAAGGIAHGNMQHRLHRGHVQQAADEALVAQLQCVVPQPRLRLLEQPRHADGRAHVRQRLVRIAFAHIVGFGQVFELERRRAVLAQRPLDALGPHRPHQAQHVQQIPARIAVVPLAFVRIMEIAEQAVADELIVEPQRVVTQCAGAGARQLFVDAVEGLSLADALGQRLLRGDAGDQGGHRRGQQVIGRPHEEADRRVDLVEIGVGADGGVLRDARAPRVLAEGFQVVEQEAVGHQCAPSRTGSCAWICASSAAQSMLSSESWPVVAATSMSRCSSVRRSASAYGVCRKVTIV